MRILGVIVHNNYVNPLYIQFEKHIANSILVRGWIKKILYMLRKLSPR